jgi:uncharacterized protein YecT (DUF1311 family)
MTVSKGHQRFNAHIAIANINIQSGGGTRELRMRQYRPMQMAPEWSRCAERPGEPSFTADAKLNRRRPDVIWTPQWVDSENLIEDGTLPTALYFGRQEPAISRQLWACLYKGDSVIKIIAALIAVAVSGVCLAANRSAMPSAEKCKALANMEAADCLGAVAGALEPILDDYYRVARASIQKAATAEQGIIAVDLNEAVGNLEQAQASWRAYRDAHCDMVGKLYTNGSGKAAGEAMCIIEHTRFRIHELWEFGALRDLPEPY